MSCLAEAIAQEFTDKRENKIKLGKLHLKSVLFLCNLFTKLLQRNCESLSKTQMYNYYFLQSDGVDLFYLPFKIRVCGKDSLLFSCFLTKFFNKLLKNTYFALFCWIAKLLFKYGSFHKLWNLWPRLFLENK